MWLHSIYNRQPRIILYICIFFGCPRLFDLFSILYYRTVCVVCVSGAIRSIINVLYGEMIQIESVIRIEKMRISKTFAAQPSTADALHRPGCEYRYVQCRQRMQRIYSIVRHVCFYQTCFHIHIGFQRICVLCSIISVPI